MFVTFVEERGVHAGTIRAPRHLGEAVTITARGPKGAIVISLRATRLAEDDPMAPLYWEVASCS